MSIEASRITHVQIGMPVLMDVEGLEHLQTVLIGAKPGHYLILAMPPGEVVGKTLARVLFRKGHQVVARYLHEGVAVGFRAQILGVIEEPDRLLFISCPQVVAQRGLRKQPRVPCLLPARLQIDGQTIEGVTKDISAGGCRFTTPDLEAAQRLADHMSRPVTVALNLPGVEGDVVIRGEQRSFMNDGKVLAVGIRFVDMAEDAKIQLTRFIERMIAASRESPG